MPLSVADSSLLAFLFPLPLCPFIPSLRYQQLLIQLRAGAPLDSAAYLAVELNDLVECRGSAVEEGGDLRAGAVPAGGETGEKAEDLESEMGLDKTTDPRTALITAKKKEK